MNNISDDVYKEKYFKYKNKYINLKNNMNEDMVGGVSNWFNWFGVNAKKVDKEIKAAKDAEDAKVAKDAEDAKVAKDAEDAKVAKDAEDAKVAKDAEDVEVAKATLNLIMDSIIKSMNNNPKINIEDREYVFSHNKTNNITMKKIKIKDREYDFSYNKTNNIIKFTYTNPQSGESSIFEFKIEMKIINDNDYKIIYTDINAPPSSSTPVVLTTETFPSFTSLKPEFITLFFEPIITYIKSILKKK
jgi:hypothetical protein